MASVSANRALADETAAPISTPVTTAPSADDVVAAAPVVERPGTISDSTNEALIAGVLGALGLAAVGGVAFAASRRRRRRTEDLDAMSFDTIENSEIEEPVIHEPVIARTSAPTLSTPVVPATSFAAAPNPVIAQATPSSMPVRSTEARVAGDPVPLPAEMPKTFEERDALLKELVAAEPDRANPFTGVRARARRAKLIMQSLGRDFESRKPRIDLSEYANRWPALRGWQPATA